MGHGERKEMREWIAVAWAPLLSLIFVIMGSCFFYFFVSIHLHHEGVDDRRLGIFHSSYFAGMLVGSWISDKVILRLGHAPACGGSALVSGLSMLAMGISSSSFLWIVARFVQGVGVGLVYVVVESWILGCASKGMRGKALSVYMIVLYLTQVASQIIVDGVDLFSSVKPYLTGALLSWLGLFPMWISGSSAPFFEPGHAERKFWKICKHSPLGVVGGIGSGVILGCLYAFIAKFALVFGYSVALLMGMTLWGSVLGQWPMGWLSDHWNRSKLLTVNYGVLASASLVIFFFPNDLTVTLIASLVVGATAFTLYPQSIAVACTPGGGRSGGAQLSITSVTAVIATAYGVGLTLGPLFLPFCTQSWGCPSLYGGIALFAAFLALLGITILRIDVNK